MYDTCLGRATDATAVSLTSYIIALVRHLYVAVPMRFLFIYGVDKGARVW